MKLDQRLRDQHFYTRSLIESSIDALVTTDPRGIFTDINKQTEALTGRTRDEQAAVSVSPRKAPLRSRARWRPPSSRSTATSHAYLKSLPTTSLDS